LRRDLDLADRTRDFELTRDLAVALALVVDRDFELEARAFDPFFATVLPEATSRGFDRELDWRTVRPQLIEEKRNTVTTREM